MIYEDKIEISTKNRYLPIVIRDMEYTGKIITLNLRKFLKIDKYFINIFCVNFVN